MALKNPSQQKLAKDYRGQVQAILSQFPQPESKSNHLYSPIQTWARIGQISMDVILNETSTQLNQKLKIYTYENPIRAKGKKHRDTYTYIGQVDRHQQPEGIGRMMWVDNSMYEGYFKEGLEHGYGRFIQKNGTYYIGMFFKGKKDGKAIEYFMREEGVDGQFKKGLYVGKNQSTSIF